MRILVTGGAGFLGSNLTERLVRDGHRVVVVDNLITGRRANIEALLGDGCEFIEADLASIGHLNVDAVFHLASPASPVGYGEFPLETLRVNALGTWRALEIARDCRAPFLLTSTSEVYGDPLVHPQTEDYYGNVDPIGPRACYDEGKRYAEALTSVFAAREGVDARIVRIFNVYGPRNAANDGRLVPNLVAQALAGEPLTVFGDGLQTRSLCYVDDMIRGLLAVMFAGNARGEVINLGNPGEHTILEYAHLIRRLTGTGAEIQHLPARPQEIARRRPDITKARRLLGWEPEVGLEEGLARTVDWMRAELNIRELHTVA
jgi:dTDP-glucose 4,6-dehydratase/UDP-glucuronate decarboxylase